MFWNTVYYNIEMIRPMIEAIYDYRMSYSQ
jgi:hypothetical protein